MAKAKKTTAATQATAASQDTTADTTADTAAKTEVTPVQLTVNDLQLLAQIVDLASRRGAFQAPELTQVGGAYNKLAAFLAYVEASTKSAEGTGEEGAAAESTTGAEA